ncbi:hypothetical protein E0H73_44000 [Kribbella pittospori]|uniref:DoxX family protein n=1 Tax=Kribbella pittospori TaxID=722689 RepID=A0A4R0JHB2_9ACTN|nr:hypothetical protein [Kribbella pittospori]TCC46311.1 hypothetical protein E0H73_44000 [Kribbella pittospori]
MSQKSTYSDNSAVSASERTPVSVLLVWPLEGRPLESLWRLVAACGAIAEAISHLPLLMQALGETPYIGVGFLLLSIAGFLLAVLLVVKDTKVVWLGSVVVAALAIVGYVLSRTTGLPQFSEHVGQWMYPLGVVSLVGEALMLGPGVFIVAKSR